MKAKIEDEFLQNHHLWAVKTKSLHKLIEEGKKRSPEYKALKKEADAHYRIAVSFIKSDYEKAQASIFSNPKLMEKASVLSKYLLDELTLAEETLMNALWKAAKPLKHDEIRKVISGQSHDTSLDNSLHNLDVKGFIKCDVDRYTVLVSESRYKHDVLQKVAVLYFNSSFTELGSFLIERGELGSSELEVMIAELGKKINK